MVKHRLQEQKKKAAYSKTESPESNHKRGHTRADLAPATKMKGEDGAEQMTTEDSIGRIYELAKEKRDKATARKKKRINHCASRDG